tara:strand:- start:3614 stop:4312 length:699 start_codon:yes stop_codon:yes gene_type:complete
VNENCIVFIFARGGSKGVPKKNIRKISGKPLIVHAIDLAKKLNFVNDIIVSTDCKEIARISEKYGAKVPFLRPKSLSDDDSNELDAWKHAIMKYEKIFNKKIDTFISLPPTAPLRSIKDVSKCYELYKDQSCDLVVTVKNSKNNPYFNMIEIGKNGFGKIVAKSAKINRRQDAPKVYDMTTVAYVGNKNYILNTNHLLDGKFNFIVVPEERAIDIDSELDFELAELVLSKNK